jgi:5,10-methylenetetrahydromethanopterin reductase
MRFCLSLGHQSWKTGSAAEQVARTFRLVRAAEAAGFDSVWLTEDPDGWDAFAVLAMLARETKTIRLGTGVTNPFLRHPNLIAASVATLDKISDGRAFLGLGRGQPEWYREALGVTMVDPLAAVRETVDLLRQWRRPPHIASSPGPIPVKHWQRSISPEGDPPIYIAATGPKMQTLAGRIADGVRFNELGSIDFISSSVKRARAAAAKAGKDPAALRFFFNPGIRITDDPHPPLDGLKATIAMIHSLPGMDRQLKGAAFDVEPVMTRVRALMKIDEILDRGGNFNEIREVGDLAAAKRAIPDEMVHVLAVVGPIDEVRRRLAELSALGVTDFFYNIDRSPGGIDALPGVIARLTDS